GAPPAGPVAGTGGDGVDQVVVDRGRRVLTPGPQVEQLTVADLQLSGRTGAVELTRTETGQAPAGTAGRGLAARGELQQGGQQVGQRHVRWQGYVDPGTWRDDRDPAQCSVHAPLHVYSSISAVVIVVTAPPPSTARQRRRHESWVPFYFVGRCGSRRHRLRAVSSCWSRHPNWVSRFRAASASSSCCCP